MICDKCGQCLPGICAGCKKPVAKGKYCSDACKMKVHRNKAVTKVTSKSINVTKVTHERLTGVAPPPVTKKVPRDSKKPFINRLKGEWRPK